MHKQQRLVSQEFLDRIELVISYQSSYQIIDKLACLALASEHIRVSRKWHAACAVGGLLQMHSQ
jgi:hypothetical protein